MSHELKKAIVAVLPEILDVMGIYSIILDVRRCKSNRRMQQER
jgi:hypothetical protein